MGNGGGSPAQFAGHCSRRKPRGNMEPPSRVHESEASLLQQNVPLARYSVSLRPMSSQPSRLPLCGPIPLGYPAGPLPAHRPCHSLGSLRPAPFLFLEHSRHFPNFFALAIPSAWDAFHSDGHSPPSSPCSNPGAGLGRPSLRCHCDQSPAAPALAPHAAPALPLSRALASFHR